MKRMLTILLLAVGVTVKAQQDEMVYVFDANWKPTKIKNAHFMLHRRHISDTCWQWEFYHFIGPLLKTEQYRDKDGSIPEGVARYYNEKGINDSVTHYLRGKKNGDSWRLFGDSLQYKYKYVFRDDSLMEMTEVSTLNRDTTHKYSDERESEYPGGLKSWFKYLNENLRYPPRALEQNIQGTVQVGFVIDKYGNVLDPYIARSLEFSVDEEAIRIVKGSGTWLAAYQNGDEVKSYKMQPINFKLQ